MYPIRGVLETHVAAWNAVRRLLARGTSSLCSRNPLTVCLVTCACFFFFFMSFRGAVSLVPRSTRLRVFPKHLSLDAFCSLCNNNPYRKRQKVKVKWWSTIKKKKRSDGVVSTPARRVRSPHFKSWLRCLFRLSAVS